MKRRAFIAAAVLLSSGVLAQPNAHRVGFVMGQGAEHPDVRRFLRVFVDEMKRLGYEDGHNLSLAVRYYGGDRAKIAALADELIAWRAEVLVANVSSTTAVLKARTSTVPIVMVTAVDAVGEGLVSSLARPGGNVTGMTSLGPQMHAKLVELAAELIPGAKRFAVLVNPEHSLAKSYEASASQAARARGIDTVAVRVSTRAEIERLGAELKRSRADGLVILTDAFLYGQRDEVLRSANNARMPAVAILPEFIASGAIATLGHDISANYRAAARYVDRILKGAKPGDLPVEQPTRFELVLNRNSARQLGIKFSPSVLARADRVVE